MNHIPIRINTLRPNNPVLFDVYIQVGEKHIHYIRKSDPFDGDRIKKLKEKGVRKLFVRIEDEPLYLDYLDAGLSDLVKPGEDLGKKSAVAYGTLVTDAENIERSLDTEKGYQRVETRMNKVVEFLASDRGALQSILSTAGAALDDHQHSANVASLSIGLALKVGGISPKEVFDLSLAALVHDIGKTKLGFSGPQDLKALTPELQKKYMRHPEESLGILSTKKCVTPAVLRLIMDHEELGEGEGYPERKKFDSMPLTSQLLSLCNHYDCLSATKKAPHAEIMKLFFEEKAHLFNLDHLTKLSELFLGK